MSKVSITRSLLDDLAMSISAKSGEAVPLTLTEMKDAVDSISGGGTTIDPLSVTSNGTYTAQSGHAYSPVTVNVPTSTPSLQSKTKTYTPTETAQTETVTADSGYDGLSSVSVSVGAISNTYVGTGITQRSSSDLTASGATVTVPSGYYSAQASKAVASGTAGTPTATKGSVSNHSVSVTPSVTNTAGYISGGTINGTAVSVSASELVSGTLSITSSGTKDVTNYASASVGAGTEGTPTATKGTVSNHSVSVTPSVTNSGGYITGGTKTGTAVTVSASELVSGSQTVTINDTYDVTNLAELVVDVSGGSVTWVTEYDGNVTIVTDNPNYVVINNWTPSHPTFADGQTWRVTWKGTEYVCPVKELTYQGSPISYIGNGQIVGSTDTSNEPFFGYMRTSTQLTFVTTDTAGTITLKMELQQSSSATLIEKTITANGTYDAEDDDADGYSSVTVNVPSGSSKNTQVVQSTTRTNASALTAIGAELTVSKTGTYDIYYSCFRTNTSASYTWATRLYINGTAYGTAENTTWTNNQQNTHLSSISLTTGDKLRVYGRNTRGTSYYVCAPTLVIVEA